LKKLFNFFASYGFAVVILILLTILTLFGTLEQASSSLFDVQNKYFNSFFLTHDLFGIPIPLPGVYLLSSLLFVNLVCGALIRVRKEWKKPGMLIAHCGILYMLVAGFVTYHFSTSGQMTLYPEERSDRYQSYYEWEIEIARLEDGLYGTRWIIPGEAFGDMKVEDTREFFQPDLPFTLMLENFLPNATPQPTPGDDGAEGFTLVAKPPEMEAAQNAAGVYALVLAKDKKEVQTGFLWGFSISPWVITVDGVDYAIELRHRNWELPFTITLDEFIRDLHARTSMASNFESVVTKTEGGEPDRKINIRMNEPLRHKGYTLFQSGWGPQNAGPDTKLFSTFSVVNNPADQWPLYSCIVIAVGLSIHFLQKLFSYLRAENRRRAS
tara:strand:+ start:294 stop:1439 length:1146 start_codon:yes stop_codon:yes gene_type:complete